MPFEQDVKVIRDKALILKGSYIPYSQCLEPTNTLIKTMPYTANGICQALAAKWIAEHAHGRSLFTWLCTPGTTNVKQGAIVNLMVNFIEGVVETGKLANQSKGAKMPKGYDLIYQQFITQKYLALYGLRRRGGMLANAGFSSSISVGASGYELASRFQSSWLKTMGEAYIMIGIWNPKEGHALAGYVAGQEAIVFDPNFGEFYFPKFDNFFKWFKFFYDRSGYAAAFPNFYMVPYAKDATGKWGKYK